MRSSVLGLVLLALFSGSIPARSADLPKSAVTDAPDLSRIERTIVREPLYDSSEPKYCLLVFGLEARTRIWLVLDGRDLYVDRNGNGDLTESGKRVRAAGSNYYQVGEIASADGKEKFGELRVRSLSYGMLLDLSVAGKRQQFVGYDPLDRFQFGNRPHSAPIAHFGGPMTIRWYARPPVFVPGQYNRFNLSVGTPGIGNGSFVAVACCCRPQGVSLIAQVEFPHRDPTQQPIQVQYRLSGD
jgi:hypothetical protein